MLEPRIKLQITIIVVSSLLLGFTFLDEVARRVEQGNQLFGAEDFEAALEAYRAAQTNRPDSPELHYNVGDALYKQGEMDEAMAAFQKAVESGDSVLGSKAFYNLGNALYKKQVYDQAVGAYEKALELDPSDLDAKINLEMAVEKLEEQQKQQDQEKGDDEKENEEKENEQKNQDEDDQKSDQEEQKDESQDDSKSQDQQESESEQNQKPEDEQQEPQDEDVQEQQQPGELSKEEAERLLDAMKDRETESQERRRIRLQGKRYRGNPW